MNLQYINIYEGLYLLKSSSNIFKIKQMDHVSYKLRSCISEKKKQKKVITSLLYY